MARSRSRSPPSAALLHIYVKTLTREHITLDVGASDTIDDVKAKLPCTLHRSDLHLFEDVQNADDQAILELIGGRTLSDYNIQNRDSLMCRWGGEANEDLFNCKAIQVFIKVRSQPSFPLDVWDRHWIAYVKDKIEDIIDIPRGMQTLTFAGEQLEDDETLRHYGIVNADTIQVSYNVTTYSRAGNHWQLVEG